MKLNEFYKRLEDAAPKRLSDEYCVAYGAYDNSGVLVDTGEEVEKVLFSLDLSSSAVERAIEWGANLIVTHHPVIYSPLKRVNGKIANCIKAGISVISMHLNLDAAQGGVDECLMQAVRKASGTQTSAEERVMHPLSVGGYGRAYAVKPISAGELAGKIKKELRTEKLWLFGDETKTVEKAASFCGAGADESSVAFAKECGADTVISADWKHHLITEALEAGMTVIQLTHYASEAYGFKKYYEKISRDSEIPCVYHEDKELF